MHELPLVLGTTLIVILVCFFVLWLLSIPLKNASIVDIFWGPGFGVIAVVAWFLADGAPARQNLLTALTVIWAARLGLYLAWRNIGHGEDPRYRRMREKAEAAGGNFATASLFKVFLLQGVLMWLISTPVQVGQVYDEPAGLGLVAAIGAVLWLIGFLFEAVGDWQLARFKADPANEGEVMDRGLWRYTRHPNYFGNACLWWGLFVIACENPVGLWTIYAPVAMTFLLLKVSGVSLLERSLKKTKPKYEEYVRRTSAFFPLPPKD